MSLKALRQAAVNQSKGLLKFNEPQPNFVVEIHSDAEPEQAASSHVAWVALISAPTVSVSRTYHGIMDAPTHECI